MSNLVSFMCGTLFGAYISQNYDIINVKDTSKIISNYLKKIEKDGKNPKD